MALDGSTTVGVQFSEPTDDGDLVPVTVLQRDELIRHGQGKGPLHTERSAGFGLADLQPELVVDGPKLFSRNENEIAGRLMRRRAAVGENHSQR